MSDSARIPDGATAEMAFIMSDGRVEHRAATSAEVARGILRSGLQDKFYSLERLLRRVGQGDSAMTWNEWLLDQSAKPHALLISSLVASAADFWARLLAVDPDARAPDAAGETSSGTFIFVWDCGRHHLEAEVAEDGAEWFYLDRESDLIESNLAGGVGTLENVAAAVVGRLREIYFGLDEVRRS